MTTILDDKKKKLATVLAAYDRIAVALSGGVDSTLLLAEAHDLLGKAVIAVTARSAIHWDQEIIDATDVAQRLGVRHLIVDSEEMELPEFLANTPERCYICKKHLFGKMLAAAKERGIVHLAHGANLDDRKDYRPGMRAACELGVVAPLTDAGLTKEDIRQMARARGLSVWNKPSMACIASRIPYGSPIELDKINQVKAAETWLLENGITACRVRHHGNIARIEVPIDQLAQLTAGDLRSRLVETIKGLGFHYVCLDLEGYVSGSLNRVLSK